jgi:hypothetical protein
MALPVTLRTACDELAVDAHTGRLLWMRPLTGPRDELVASADDQPAFAVQYLDADRQYRRLTSLDAEEVAADVETGGDGTRLSLTFARLGGLHLDVTTTVRTSGADPFSRWRVAVRNGAGLEVVDVQYPFLVAPWPQAGAADGGAILLPQYMGALHHNPSPANLPADEPEVWQFSKTYPSTGHYPGSVFAQFLAYLRGGRGLYLACQDTEGGVKLIKPVARPEGLRLGVAHVGDWPAEGERELEYDVVVRSFEGDWYDAADIYRAWSLGQKWAAPLYRRDDVPDAGDRAVSALREVRAAAGGRGGGGRGATGRGADELGARRPLGLSRLLPARRRR